MNRNTFAVAALLKDDAVAMMQATKVVASLPPGGLQQTNWPCREFVVQMSVEGRDHMLRGVACRRSEDKWEPRT